MDHLLIRVFLWFGFIWFIENTVVSSPKELLDNDSEENMCTTELHTCSTKTKDAGLSGPKGETGPSGLQGPQGPPGPNGEMGPSADPGVRGEPGQKGDKGSNGLNGNPGAIGEKGPNGTPGSKGDKGDMGLKGLQGILGEKGEKGEMGPPGPKGETGVGSQGRNGSFIDLEKDGFDEEDVIHACGKGTETGKYIIHKSEPFEVICDMEKNRTCIPLRDRADSSVIDSESINHGKKPFWVSEIGLDFLKLYGVSENQLEWLISQSTFTSLEITYHCKNSYILHKDKTVDGDLRLMSWKEAVIGPRPSENSPYFYVVSTENDGCKDSGDHKTEWKQSTIQISSHLKVLPVTDFYIRDIREGEEQKFYLELKELCFNF